MKCTVHFEREIDNSIVIVKVLKNLECRFDLHFLRYFINNKFAE